MAWAKTSSVSFATTPNRGLTLRGSECKRLFSTLESASTRGSIIYRSYQRFLPTIMKPRLEMKNRERQTKRTMWFRGQNVPILYSTRRKDIFGSEDWIARGTLQRIGTIIFATVFFCGSAALFVASPRLRDELSEMIGGVLGRIVGTGLAAFAILVACIGMFLTFRLVRGVVRAYSK